MKFKLICVDDPHIVLWRGQMVDPDVIRGCIRVTKCEFNSHDELKLFAMIDIVAMYNECDEPIPKLECKPTNCLVRRIPLANALGLPTHHITASFRIVNDIDETEYFVQRV